MPTYEYRCPEGHMFDVFQKMSDEPGAVCPTCGAESERQISAGAGFLFKGSGFYITDSRSPEYAKKASAEKSQGGGDGKKESEKKEAGTSAGSDGSSSSDGAGAGSGASSGVSKKKPSSDSGSAGD